MRTSWFEKFLEVTFGWPSLPLEVTFGSHYALLAGVIGFLIATTITGYNGDAMGHRFCPFSPPLVPFLAPLTVALVGMARPLLVTALVLPRMKAAPTASLSEECWVAMSSSSLVVFGCLRPSS
jgi:hypothetical protein